MSAVQIFWKNCGQRRNTSSFILFKTKNIFVPFPRNKPWFLCFYGKSHLKTLLKKEKLLITSNLSLSQSVFCHTGELFAIFIKFKIVVCKLSVWKSLKFVIRKRLKRKQNISSRRDPGT